MQATVHRFDPDSSTGTVLLDSGELLPFTADVFVASALLKLRLGQRISIALETTKTPDTPRSGQQHIDRMWIVGIGDGEIIR